jgi:tRNA A-37 threonylcarbamoyl transferase component Bud32
MKVYLDKVRIVDGKRFDENFARGLAASTVFTPLVSANCLKNFVQLGRADKEDFVLTEWIMALELQKRGIVKAIFPIMVGEQEKDGRYSQSFFEELRDGRVSWPASEGFHAAGGGALPDVTSAKSIALAKEFLGMLDPPVQLSEELSVKVVVERLLTFQAILLHFENDSITSLEPMQRLVRMDSTHGKRAKEVAQKHVAQTCAERIAKVVVAEQASPDGEHAGQPARPLSQHGATTSRSAHWRGLLDRSTPAAERHTALQSVLEEWHAARWVLVEKELGHGSSGAVFASSDAHLGQVAIKFIHGEEPNKMKREIALMKRVAHEHVCKYYEHHVSQDGQLFGIVMELLESGSLAQRIKDSTHGRIREFEVIQIAFDTLAALTFMHEKSVIHRDIKSANIVLTEKDGRVLSKLIDFSIAAVEMGARDDVSKTMLTGTTALQSAVGTAHYMSPEQIQAGMVVTPQTDLWSLGVVLYECLSGALPFAPLESNHFKVTNAIVNTEPPELSDVIEEVGAVSDPVAAVVLCALEKDMSKRFATAADMIAALEKATQMSGDERFDLFISYRFWCDQGFVWGDQDSLYAACSRCQLRPGREHRLRVYLDKVQIVVSGAVHGLLYGCRWR